MDAFYASVEQRDRPELRGKPVIVGAVGARGVVSAASYEAREFGVRSAMPGFRARELCPDGIFLEGDMKKYAAVSRLVHAVFQEFTDTIEPLALDEAFLDVGGSISLLGSPISMGRALKGRVFERTRLVVSVGIAPNKLVAKVACSLGKPDGLKLVLRGEEAALLAPLPLRALWGVGPKAEGALKAKGFATIGDLARAPLSGLRSVFGDHAAEMQARARGQDDRPVESKRSPKSIGEEATFAENVGDRERLESALVAHAEAVAARARRSGQEGRTVVLKVKLARRRSWAKQVVSNHELFPTLNRQTKLGEPTADGKVISDAAIRLLRQLELRESVRLIGVTLTDLVGEASPRQLGLFDPAPRPSARTGSASASLQSKRGDRLGRTLDAIADKFGNGAIARGDGRVQKIAASDRLKWGERPLDDEGQREERE